MSPQDCQGAPIAVPLKPLQDGLRGNHPKVVQELLGHSRVSTTLDLYTHSFSQVHKGAVQDLADWLSPVQVTQSGS